MKKRPIIFDGESVRAIRDRRKTQTRRVIKPQPVCRDHPGEWQQEHRGWAARFAWLHHGVAKEWIRCPYGAVGDLLWVKETWQDWCPIWGGAWCGHGTKQGQAENHEVYYRADDASAWKRGEPKKWKSPRYMPNWASRYTLQITELRVERLQEITHDDALAEGLDCRDTRVSWEVREQDATVPFRRRWDSINAKREHPWEANDWVWVIGFRRVDV